MALFGSAQPAPASSTTGDTSKDIEMVGPPGDSISDMAFSPTNEQYLAVSSWDKKVYIYEITASSAELRYRFDCKAVALSVCWSPDGMQVAAGDAAGNVYVADLRNFSNPGEITAPDKKMHDDGVKCLRWFNTPNNVDYLVTGSWDKTVKMWNMKEGANLQCTIQCMERVYTMDIKQHQNRHLMVIGTAERHIHMVDITADPGTIAKTITSPLKWQTRVVSCFADASGFAVGSIEGRCAIQYVDEKDSNLNFSFKCHRQPDAANREIAKVYSVNAISFHPIHGTFSTAGSDGTFHFWDKDAKHRLKGYPEVGGSITATAFSCQGNFFAYAVSYDWSKGYNGNTPSYPCKIKLHAIIGDECKPRPGSKKR